jgi:glyoxylase-like metal-dependent hydrolase (beta-lactamase superfamily II)
MGTAFAFPFHKLFAQVQDDPFTPLRRNVGTFVGQGGTIGWLVNKDAVVIVDSQFPNSARTCLNGLEQKTSIPFDLLINTHHHRDHTSGNPVFKPKVNHIVAHKNVPDLMRKASDKKDSELALPDTTYQTSWKHTVGDETVHLTYYGPAHTGGDSVIYFEKANVAHMGDLVFNRAFPFIDRPGGASITNWIKVLEQAANNLPDDALFIFGHGNSNYGITGTKKDLKVKQNYLSALLEYTQKGIDAGTPKTELMNKKTLAGFEEFDAPGWSLPLSANIEVAYAELTAK